MSDTTTIDEVPTFADVLREMDIEYLVMGEYGITVEEAAKFIDHDHFVFLDLRTQGFYEVKAMKGRLDQMAGAITPGRFYSLSR